MDILTATCVALHDLGATADAVAETLTKAGVRGHPHLVKSCPVARYLSDQLGRTAIVSEDKTCIRVQGHYVEVANPQPVRSFVAAFDMGIYPMLVSNLTDRGQPATV